MKKISLICNDVQDFLALVGKYVWPNPRVEPWNPKLFAEIWIRQIFLLALFKDKSEIFVLIPYKIPVWQRIRTIELLDPDETVEQNRYVLTFKNCMEGLLEKGNFYL